MIEVQISVSENGKNRPEYTLDSDLRGEITLMDLLLFTKQALIVTADEVLKEEQALGFDKKPILIVDGYRNKPVQAVNPLGSIKIIARQQFGDMLLDTYEGLLKRSKVLTGRYKNSHYVFWNGIQVATTLEGLKSWVDSGPDIKDRDKIRIVNIQPYARRLELLGVTAQRTNARMDEKGRRRKQRTGIFFKVPNGAYQLTYRSVRSKYKQNALVRFEFLPGNVLGLSGTFRGDKLKKSSAGRPYLYPTIVFQIQERGIL